MDVNAVGLDIGIVSSILTIGVVGAALIGLFRAPKATFMARANGTGDLWLTLSHSGGAGVLSNVTIAVANIGDSGEPTSGDWGMSWAPELAMHQQLVYEIFDPRQVIRMDPEPRAHETWRHLSDEDGVIVWVTWEQRPLWWRGQRLVRWDAAARRAAA